jgi:chromosome partitioning protein
VLLLDIDPQANLSVHLDVDIYHLEASMYDVLVGQRVLRDAILPTSTEGLYLVPSNIDLSGAELELVNTVGRETILRDAIDEIRGQPVPRAGSPQDGASASSRPLDFVIIDCPPSLGLLTINALGAANEVFIPVQTQFFALQGMSKLLDVIRLVRKRINPSLHISGILACLFDTRTRLSHDVLAEIREFFKERVFETRIRDNIRLAEAPSYGQTIFEYASGSHGAEDYAALAAEVIARSAAASPRESGIPALDA